MKKYEQFMCMTFSADLSDGLRRLAAALILLQLNPEQMKTQTVSGIHSLSLHRA